MASPWTLLPSVSPTATPTSSGSCDSLAPVAHFLDLATPQERAGRPVPLFQENDAHAVPVGYSLVLFSTVTEAPACSPGTGPAMQAPYLAASCTGFMGRSLSVNCPAAVFPSPTLSGTKVPTASPSLAADAPTAWFNLKTTDCVSSSAYGSAAVSAPADGKCHVFPESTTMLGGASVWFECVGPLTPEEAAQYFAATFYPSYARSANETFSAQCTQVCENGPPVHFGIFKLGECASDVAGLLPQLWKSDATMPESFMVSSTGSPADPDAVQFSAFRDSQCSYPYNAVEFSSAANTSCVGYNLSTLSVSRGSLLLERLDSLRTFAAGDEPAYPGATSAPTTAGTDDVSLAGYVVASVGAAALLAMLLVLVIRTSRDHPDVKWWRLPPQLPVRTRAVDPALLESESRAVPAMPERLAGDGLRSGDGVVYDV